MKMSIFTTLAKARLNIGVTASSLVAVRHMINCLDCGYIGFYMSNKPNLLYKTWTAGRRWRSTKNKKKRKNFVCARPHTSTTKRPVTLHTPSPVRQGWRPPINKTATVLIIAKIWSWVPGGLNAKADWLIDPQLQSNSASDWMFVLKD